MKLFFKNFIFLIFLAIFLIFARFFIDGPGKHMVFVFIINIWFTIWLLFSYTLSSYFFKNALLKSIFCSILFLIPTAYFHSHFFFIELIVYVISIFLLSFYFEEKFR